MRAVPGLRDDVDAVGLIADAAKAAASAGQDLVRAAGIAEWTGTSTAVLGSGGYIRIDLLEKASPFLRSAADSMAEARAALGPTAEMDLMEPIAVGAAEARDSLATDEKMVDSAADLAEVLPPVLGADGRRRYLLAVQNLSDPRGSGGFLGLYGVLESSEGHLHMSELRHVSYLRAQEPVDAPADVVDRYSLFGSLVFLHAATSPSDFPTSARLALGIWEASGRRPVDGVVSVDPVALGYLTAATGPVEAAGYAPLSGGDLVTVFEHDSFLLPEVEGNQAQEALGEAAWASILESSPPPMPLAAALSQASRERHLQVYSRNEDEQRLLEALGVSGRVEPGPNPLLLTWHGASINRVGYFAVRDVEYEAEIAPDGSADVVVRATVLNTAPVDGPQSMLLGYDFNNEPNGFFAAYVSIDLPQGANATRMPTVDGRRPKICVGACEQGSFMTVLVEAKAGEQTTAEFSYHVPPDDSAGTFELQILPQPAIRPAHYVVRITPPPGRRATSGSAGMAVHDSTAVWELDVSEPVELEVLYT